MHGVEADGTVVVLAETEVSFRKGGTLLILFKNHVKILRRRGGGQIECQKFARYNCTEPKTHENY